jgi:hypothetical protein
VKIVLLQRNSSKKPKLLCATNANEATLSSMSTQFPRGRINFFFGGDTLWTRNEDGSRRLLVHIEKPQPLGTGQG